MAGIIELDDVHKYYSLSRRAKSPRHDTAVRAVDGVSIVIEAGRAASIVGETGCGKSTLGKLILDLERPSSGRVMFEGIDLQTLDAESRRAFHAAVQAVFQDPWGSLNPRMRVDSLIAEPLVIAGWHRERVRERVGELLQLVGLGTSHRRLYPHEFSGGQRQRIAIARALGPNPRLIVLDEPVSALDLSVRAQIINLLSDLQEQYGLGYLMISHDLSSVWVLSERVYVMYLGQIVEVANTEELRLHALHPYTQALMASSLPADPRITRPEVREIGEPPSAADPPAGCRFHTRCPYTMQRCQTEMPILKEVSRGHTVACHLHPPI